MALTKVERKVQSVLDRAAHKLAVSGAKSQKAQLSEEKRMLLNASVPRPRMGIRGDMRKTVVSGLEVVDQFVTSKIPKKIAVSLNPAQAQTFPRLSGFAGQFEKYRFKRIRLHYHTAAPATRSGALGLAVFTQVTTPGSIPNFMPEFGSYEYSAVGTVASNLTTPWWIPKDPEYFFIGYNGSSFGSLVAPEDPLKVFQGSLCFLTRDAVDADVGLLAGYLSIEYEVEFVNLRPSLNKFILQGPPAAYLDSLGSWQPGQTVVVGGGNNIVNLPQTALGQAGSWAIDKLAEWGIGAGSASLRGYGDILRGISYVGTLAGALTSVAAESINVKDHFSIVDYPPLVRQTGFLKEKKEQRELKVDIPDPEIQTIVTWYNPKYCGWLPESQMKILSPPVLPAVAGDVTVQLSVYNPEDASTDVVLSQNISGGTSAQTVSLSGTFTLPAITDEQNDGSELSPFMYWTIIPTGTESRTFSLLTAEMSVRGSGV